MSSVVVGSSEVRALEERCAGWYGCAAARSGRTRSSGKRSPNGRQKTISRPLSLPKEVCGEPSLSDAAEEPGRVAPIARLATRACCRSSTASSTNGLAWLTGAVNWDRREKDCPSSTRKRVHRIMQQSALLLEPYTGRREVAFTIAR